MGGQSIPTFANTGTEVNFRAWKLIYLIKEITESSRFADVKMVDIICPLEFYYISSQVFKEYLEIRENIQYK